MGEKAKENINLGHRTRLRERFLNLGIDAFYYDYEKLEFILAYIIPRRDVKPLAKELIKRFKNLENIFKGEIRELQKIEGIGESTALFLKFIGELNKEIFYERAKYQKSSEMPQLYSKNDLISYLKNEIGFLDRENFFVLFLDSANRIIDTPDLRSGVIFQGTLDKSAIYAREILKKVTEQHRMVDEEIENKVALKIRNEGEITELSVKKIMEKAYKNRAKSVIFAHNHPSGNLKPSRSDIEITREMKETLKLAEIRLLDHIIVSRESYFSFLEEGLIEY